MRTKRFPTGARSSAPSATNATTATSASGVSGLAAGSTRIASSAIVVLLPASVAASVVTRFVLVYSGSPTDLK